MARTDTDTETATETDGRGNTAGVPGEQAARPQEIPPRGWLQVVKRGWAEAKADHVPLLAAGVAFYTFLSIVPTLTALVFIYGLVADPAQIADQVNSIGSALPGDVRSVLTTQLSGLAANNTGAGIGAVVSVLLALWSASGGMTNMMTAISLAYDEDEKRSFVVKRGLALLLTVGAIVAMVLILALIAALPLLLQLLDSPVLRVVLQVVRYLVLIILVMVILAVLYRVAPDRDAPKMRWVSVGAGAATVLWVLASVAFSLYAAHGSYSKYGALASVVVLLFWLWITAYAILLGAEINAEAEQQTARDTTTGPQQPLGQRGAVKADSVPGAADRDSETDSGAGAETDSETGDRDRRSNASAAATSANSSSTNHKEVRPVTDPTSAQNRRQSDPGVGELIRQLTEDSSRLVRDEIQLAKVEITDKAKDLGVGVGAFGAAGVVALFGVGALIATAILALALVLPGWLAALIVTVVLFAIAGVAALVGKRKVDQGAPPVPDRAIGSAKQDVATIKESAKS